jgi:hypothetical protein
MPPSLQPAGRDRFLVALGLLGLVRLALLAPGLVPADLNLTYPFMDGDSWEWIANGLRLAGEDVRYSGRAPLLPLAVALLHRLSALSWLPVLLQGLFVATVLAFYSLATRLVPRRAAFTVAPAAPVSPGDGRRRRRSWPSPPAAKASWPWPAPISGTIFGSSICRSCSTVRSSTRPPRARGARCCACCPGLPS